MLTKFTQQAKYAFLAPVLDPARLDVDLIEQFDGEERWTVYYVTVTDGGGNTAQIGTFERIEDALLYLMGWHRVRGYVPTFIDGAPLSEVEE